MLFKTGLDKEKTRTTAPVVDEELRAMAEKNRPARFLPREDVRMAGFAELPGGERIHMRDDGVLYQQDTATAPMERTRWLAGEPVVATDRLASTQSTLPPDVQQALRSTVRASEQEIATRRQLNVEADLQERKSMQTLPASRNISYAPSDRAIQYYQRASGRPSREGVVASQVVDSLHQLNKVVAPGADYTFYESASPQEQRQITNLVERIRRQDENTAEKSMAKLERIKNQVVERGRENYRNRQAAREESIRQEKVQIDLRTARGNLYSIERANTPEAIAIAEEKAATDLALSQTRLAREELELDLAADPIRRERAERLEEINTQLAEGSLNAQQYEIEKKRIDSEYAEPLKELDRIKKQLANQRAEIALALIPTDIEDRSLSRQFSTQQSIFKDTSSQLAELRGVVVRSLSAEEQKAHTEKVLELEGIRSESFEKMLEISRESGRTMSSAVEERIRDLALDRIPKEKTPVAANRFNELSPEIQQAILDAQRNRQPTFTYGGQTYLTPPAEGAIQ